MIDTIYFWTLFVLVCIIAITPALIFFITFFNNEDDNVGSTSYLVVLSALLLGLVPMVGVNVLPLEKLNLSFWIAEGIIGVSLFLIFIFHVKRNPHYLLSMLLTLGMVVILWFAHADGKINHDLPYYGNFSFSIPESLYSIWLPAAIVLILFALMLRRKEVNYVEVPKESSSAKSVNIENSFGNVLMRKSIEELTERVAEQNDKIESHLNYLLHEIDRVKIENTLSDSKQTSVKYDSLMLESVQQLASKIDSLLETVSVKGSVNNSSHSNIMLIRELTHFIATPLASIEGNVELLSKNLNLKKTDKNLINYLERIKTSVTICKGILETYREIYLCSKSDDKFGLRELIMETFELYREREHKKLALNTNIQSSYPSYSNYFMMSLLLPILSNAVTASSENTTVELIENKGVVKISNTYVGDVDIDKMEIDGYSSKPEHYGLGLYTVRHLLATRKLGKLKCYKQNDRIYFEIPIK